MKRIIWIIAVVMVIGYFFNSYVQEQARREAERAERAETERIEQVAKVNVSEMASRTNAVSDWEENLSKGDRFRIEPILTVELERLWLQQRPILFLGAIKDIATHDQTHYIVTVERSLFSSSDYMFETELQLSLLSNRDQVDHFVTEHPDLFEGYGFNNSIAVVALVKSIRTAYFLGEEGQYGEARIGDGELLDILYTGDAIF